MGRCSRSPQIEANGSAPKSRDSARCVHPFACRVILCLVQSAWSNLPGPICLVQSAWSNLPGPICLVHPRATFAAASRPLFQVHQRPSNAPMTMEHHVKTMNVAVLKPVRGQPRARQHICACLQDDPNDPDLCPVTVSMYKLWPRPQYTPTKEIAIRRRLPHVPSLNQSSHSRQSLNACVCPPPATVWQQTPLSVSPRTPTSTPWRRIVVRASWSAATACISRWPLEWGTVSRGGSRAAARPWCVHRT